LPTINVYLVQPGVPLDIYVGLVVERPQIQLVVEKNVNYEVSAEKFQQMRTPTYPCFDKAVDLEQAAQVLA
jgi:hypothetical protein